jgi:hypothetical protein
MASGTWDPERPKKVLQNEGFRAVGDRRCFPAFTANRGGFRTETGLGTVSIGPTTALTNGGFKGVRADIAMMRTPDGQGGLS